MRKKDTVLLDFDGTIMDTNRVIINSWQHTFMHYTGEKRSEEEIIATFGEPLEKTLKKVLPDVPVGESIEVYRSYHRDNFGEMIKLFPGVKDMLEELKKRGYKTGLVTSRLAFTTRQGVEKYGIGPYIDAMVTADDTEKHKPDPEPIMMMLEKLGSAASRSVMVGDTMFDMECAKNAGVTSVLVGWALAPTKEELEGPAGPDHIIGEAGELISLLETYR